MAAIGGIVPDSTLPEESLRNIVDRIADGILVVADSGIVRFANPAAEALFGSPRDQLVGRTFAYPLNDGAAGEIEISSGNGAGGIAEMRVSRIQWQGQTAHLVALRDMSARLRTADLHHRLLRADKQAAIARLSASIAHEINNPAAFILANLAVMRDIADDFEAAFRESGIDRALQDKYQIEQSLDDLRDMVKDNQSGVERIRAFVRELRALAQESGGVVERLDINNVATTACDVAAGMIGRHVRLVRAFGPVPVIAGDRFRLQQVVVNLVLNAADAIASAEAGGNLIEVTTSADRDSVRIAVRDTGRGVPEEHIHKIFDPLFVADPADGTLGMGLAIASEIVGNHGGRIEATSRVGEGSCFEVVLPRDTGLSPAEPEADAAPGQVRARVLLIEDDAAMRRSIRRTLEPYHDLVEAAGGAAALEIIARDRDYDVVLCALAMVEMDGPALFDAFEQRAPDLVARLIFIGDSSLTPRIRRFVESARVMVLEKPVSRTLLCDIIERRGR